MSVSGSTQWNFDENNQSTPKDVRLKTGISLVGKLKVVDIFRDGLFTTFYDIYRQSMDYGALKYEYGNFEASPATADDALDSLLRHLIELKLCEVTDKESNLLHIYPIVSRLALAIVKEYRKVSGLTYRTVLHEGDKLTPIQRIENMAIAFYNTPTVKKLYNEITKESSNMTLPDIPDNLTLPSGAHMSEEIILSLAKNKIWALRTTGTLSDWLFLTKMFLIEWLKSTETSSPYTTMDKTTLMTRITTLDLAFWCSINAGHCILTVLDSEHN
jgi:hypothetical protein